MLHVSHLESFKIDVICTRDCKINTENKIYVKDISINAFNAKKVDRYLDILTECCKDPQFAVYIMSYDARDSADMTQCR